MDFRGSFNKYSEIAMGSMDAVGEAINANEATTAERAPQKPAGISRNVTADIQKVVNFESPREYWDSLPIVSKLFMFMTFIDVAMVIFYSVWQFLEMFDNDSCTRAEADCAKKEEHLHVVLGMLITAFFLVIFVVDAISQENDFELLACLLLTIVIAGRVIYFIYSAHYEQWAQILGIAIVAFAAVITTLLGILTYNKFGWRVYSRLACDLRLKHAAERTVMYFAQNRFTTLVKLDFQFLVLNLVMGIVMSVQNADLSVKNNDYTRILGSCTVIGFLIGLPWLAAAYYAVQAERTKLAEYLKCLSVFTLLPPIGAVVAVYVDGDERDDREATESLLISTVLLVLFRISVLYYMAKLMTLSVAKQEQDKSDKSDFTYRFRMSNKNPDLLPLLKGAWLIKQSPTSPNKRRFFQLSQDYTTLRWAWNSYVLLYYVDDIETNDVTMTITLRFSIEPDLVVRFENMNDYDTWKRGFHVLLALLMAPDTELERESRIHINPKQKKKGDREQSFTFEAFLNRLGVTTRNHAYGSRHPLREAEQELKKKLDSKRTPNAGAAEVPQKLAKSEIDEAMFRRQSSRIPSAKQDPESALYNQPSLDSQGGTSADGDSGTPSQTSDLLVADTPTGILPGMQTLVETIDYCDLDFGKFLGSGAEGAVWAAWYLDTPVAVKKTNSVHELEMTMYAGQHDNVVGLRGLAKEGSATYIVLEYCPRGTLDVLLHHTMTSRWDPLKVLQMIRCVARGILHLHSRKPAILHRDLKPANVFVSHGLVLKIGDFGMSRQLKSAQQNRPETCGNGPRIRRTLTPGVIGTASYTAPELLDERLQSEGYDVARFLKADVYSFGVTMWEIVKRERPFEGMQFYEIVAGWSSDPESMKLEPFSVPKDLSAVAQKIFMSLQELTTECTAMNPERRPDMKSVVKRLKELHVEVQRMAGETHV